MTVAALTVTPSIPWEAEPDVISWSAMETTRSEGIAKPRPIDPAWPSAEVASDLIEELMPMTAPVASNNGPPELPGLMEASIWMALVTTRSEDACVWSCEVESSSMETSTGRLSAETMPVVTVFDKPSGAPIAMTGAPTCRLCDEAKRATVRFDGGFSRRMTARSVVLSWPTMPAP